MIVPMTINYVSPDQYGIWLTISSIVAWISYFDLGLGHGLRNKFAECKAKGNSILASQYISTAYAIIGMILICVFIVFIVFNYGFDWQKFLKIYDIDNIILQKLMFVFVGFFCITMFLKVLNSIILGDQRTALASSISVLEQAISLLVIYVLSICIPSNLLYLAVITGGVPCVVLFSASLIMFSPRGYFSTYKPSLKFVKLKLSKQLLGLGTKFFIVQLSLLVIFQMVNIILSRNCGQLVVSQYQLSYKYFNMIYMASVIILTPFWSAFTDAYSKKDFIWMQNMFKRLNLMVWIAVPILIVMVLISPLFFKFWIHNSIEIPMALHVCMACYIFSMIYASVHMYILNGLGKVTIQLFIYVIFAILAIPVMNSMSKEVGAYGILFFLSLVYVLQAFIGHIQISRILKNQAKGLWDR